MWLIPFRGPIFEVIAAQITSVIANFVSNETPPHIALGWPGPEEGIFRILLLPQLGLSMLCDYKGTKDETTKEK